MMGGILAVTHHDSLCASIKSRTREMGHPS